MQQQPMTLYCIAHQIRARKKIRPYYFMSYHPNLSHIKTGKILINSGWILNVKNDAK